MRTFLLFTSLTAATVLMHGCGRDVLSKETRHYGADHLYGGTVSSGELYPDGAVIQLRKSTISTPAVIVLLPDGYSADELKKEGRFENDAKRVMNACLDIEPFSSLKYVFDFRMGMSRNGYGVYTDENNVLFCDYDKVRSDAVSSIPVGAYYNTIVVVLTKKNNSIARTTTYYSTSGTFAISVISIEQEYELEETIQHEVCGHGFGRLEDEYDYITSYKEGIREKVESKQGFGIGLNVSLYDGVSSWDHLIGRKGYEGVGYYEGAIMLKNGAWRSEETSIMREHNGTGFNAISRELIWKRAMSLMGKEFSLEEFLNYDKVNLTSTKTLTKSDIDNTKVEPHNHLNCVHQVVYVD